MRAAILHRYGPPDVLTLERDWPEPECGPRDVLVDVHAAAINPIDVKLRGGKQRGAIRYTLPWVLGLDVSGVVAEVGRDVKDLAVGDEVWSTPSHRRPGCYAERVAIDRREVARKPPSLTHVEAASLPLVALTAWQCIVPWLEPRPGQRVLVQAGSGGVGTVAIQLAKAFGAHVVTTCSARNAELVRGLGADEVVDYRQQPYWEALRGAPVDIVLESVGGEALDRAFDVVRKGGRIASIASGLPEATERYGPNLGVVATGLGIGKLMTRGLFRHVDAKAVVRTPSEATLDRVAALVAGGEVRAVVDRTYPLADVAEAHAYLETGRARGKVVLTVR